MGISLPSCIGCLHPIDSFAFMTKKNIDALKPWHFQWSNRQTTAFSTFFNCITCKQAHALNRELYRCRKSCLVWWWNTRQTLTIPIWSKNNRLILQRWALWSYKQYIYWWCSSRVYSIMRTEGWISRYALTLCFKRAKTHNDELNAPFLQKLMKNLHVKNLCEKVHASLACADSLS